MLITYHTLGEAAALVRGCQAALAAALPRNPGNGAAARPLGHLLELLPPLAPPKRLGFTICFKKAKLNPVEQPPPASRGVTNTAYGALRNKIQLSRSKACVTSNSETSPTSRQLLFIQPFCNQPTEEKKKEKKTPPKTQPAIHYISVSPPSGNLPGNRIQLAKCAKALLISLPNIHLSFPS